MHTSPTGDVTIFVKGALKASSIFSLRFPRFSKLISLERKQISTKSEKPSSQFFTVCHISEEKYYQKFRCIDTLTTIITTFDAQLRKFIGKWLFW